MLLRAGKWLVDRFSRDAGRDLQRTLDLGNLDFAFSLREFVDTQGRIPVDDEISAIGGRTASRSPRDLAERAQSAAHTQVVALLSALGSFDFDGRAAAMEGDFKRRGQFGSGGDGELWADAESRARCVESHQHARRAELLEELRDALLQDVGFALHLRGTESLPPLAMCAVGGAATSPAPDSIDALVAAPEPPPGPPEAAAALSAVAPSEHSEARGVMLRGRVYPGTVVAFYPGRVFTPDRLALGGGKRALLAMESPNLMARLDRAIVDGTVVGRRYNPFALAHLVRSPAHEGDANVMPFLYNFPQTSPASKPPASSLPEALAPYVPNTFFKRPLIDMPGVHVPGIVLVTTREVENEELFMHYRLSPKGKKPAWYRDFAAEESARLAGPHSA